MRTALFEQDEYIAVRLPWPIICKLAVRARFTNVSFNDLCEMAISERVRSAAPSADKPGEQP